MCDYFWVFAWVFSFLLNVLKMNQTKWKCKIYQQSNRVWATLMVWFHLWCCQILLKYAQGPGKYSIIINYSFFHWAALNTFAYIFYYVFFFSKMVKMLQVSNKTHALFILQWVFLVFPMLFKSLKKNNFRMSCNNIK